jgi:hypothetical protein
MNKTTRAARAARAAKSKDLKAKPLSNNEVKYEIITRLLKMGKTTREILDTIGGSHNTVNKVKRKLGMDIRFTKRGLSTATVPVSVAEVASTTPNIHVSTQPIVNPSDRVSIITTVSGATTTITINIQD